MNINNEHYYIQYVHALHVCTCRICNKKKIKLKGRCSKNIFFYLLARRSSDSPAAVFADEGNLFSMSTWGKHNLKHTDQPSHPQRAARSQPETQHRVLCLRLKRQNFDQNQSSSSLKLFSASVQLYGKLTTDCAGWEGDEAQFIDLHESPDPGVARCKSEPPPRARSCPSAAVSARTHRRSSWRALSPVHLFYSQTFCRTSTV